MKYIFFHFTPGKIIISCKNIFDTNIISQGTQTSWKITGIPGSGGGEVDKQPLEWRFQGSGGLTQKSPLWGVGDMDIFWNYTARKQG